MTYRLNFGKVYRGRPFKGEKLESVMSQVSTLEDIWAPPKQYSKKNRCNDAQESVLYVSTHISTIPYELGINSGDLFATCTFSQIHDFTFIPIVGWSQLMKITEGGLPKIIGNYFNDKSKNVQSIDAELSRLFTSSRIINEHDDLYDHTIGLTRLYFKNGGDGLMYRSVASDFKGVNLVLQPTKVEPKLKPKKCNIYRLIEKKHDSIKVENLKAGTFDKNRIIWSTELSNRFIQFEK